MTVLKKKRGNNADIKKERVIFVHPPEYRENEHTTTL